ncbi:MAG: hypothetical protein AB7V46_17225 [Thermomicrobiales bacterium]
MTLTEARAKLKSISRPTCISMSCWDHQDERPASLSWDVWDGRVSHTSDTLEGAVQKALDANRPVTTESDLNLDVILQLG